MWDLLSGPKVSSEVRAKVGRYMHKHGHWATNEFALAERRLAKFPQAEWEVVSVAPEGWHEKVDVHKRNMLVLLAGVLRHPQCDPATDLVWGPEVYTDKDTGQCSIGYLADLCNSDWYRRQPHGAAGRVSARDVFHVCKHELCVHASLMFANMNCKHQVEGHAELREGERRDRAHLPGARRHND